MTEEEQFVNIDLNDDNVCSICKLGTDIETLSFCHICFELSIEEIVVHENPSRSAVSEILRPALLTPTTMPRSKALKSPFFPILMLGLNCRRLS
ncbi:hypothetical protein GDO81_009926 [Engystomops pustulosus]|uniref:Uncharacterized protein n=1 Tax=Engystomops pustulosus TaxID=76066 RepID=A0AAV7BWA8_ENGPU|nr:hypothetical protein GDO81_009926 [Engystomops pustulosus]